MVVKATKASQVQNVDNEGNLGDINRATAVVLANLSGIALDEDTDMNGLYTIVLSGGGAQDADFYIPVDDVNVNEQIVFKLRVNSAVVLNTADFQTYAQGAYITDPAYGAGPVAADGSSEEWTSMFPLRDLMNKGNKHRVRVNVAGDCTVSCIAMVVAL
jgi:hypothetical protein